MARLVIKGLIFCLKEFIEMNLDLLNKIKQGILSQPFETRPKSNEFCSLYVDGTGNLTFEEADATFHSFRLFSNYEYPNYLFVSGDNDIKEIDKILNKYPYTFIYKIPKLKNSVEYNNWMINVCFKLLPQNIDGILTHQSDGMLIKAGWENYVSQFDYLGAPWREPIKLKTDIFNFPAVTVGNGGFSFRRLNKLIQVLNQIEKYGGQSIIKGIYIDGILKHNHMYVCEDILFVWLGFGFNIFAPVTDEEARAFSIEPIEFCNYSKKENFGFHKIDY